jgi:HAE1 family hydrophobic/amphiphilic exporter-1
MTSAQHPIFDRHARLPAFALKRPVTVLMLLVSAILLGAVAYQRMPLSLAPDKLDHPFLFISMPYPASDPREVEQKIAKPVEEILGSVKGIDQMRSFSNESGATFWVELKEDVRIDAVYTEVKDRLERIVKDLPEDFDRYYVFRWRGADWPVLVVGFTADFSEPAELYRVIDEKVKVRLQRIDGVASVDAPGLREKRVAVKLRQDRLEAHRVDISSVFQALQRSNFTLSGGKVVHGDTQYYVRTTAKLRSVEEIAALRLPGTQLRLSHVADVAAELPEEERITQVDGRPTFVLLVKKESKANTVKVCEQALEVIESLKHDPETRPLQHFFFFNQGQMVGSSLENLVSSGMWGGAFAMLLLYAFLRKLRATLLIAMAIPLSILVTVVVLYFLGMNLNVGSMLGLMIGIGMLVDNAIVVVENVFRLRDEGLPLRESALRGASEVGVAITASTATTAIVFLPLLFMSGPLGVWMFEIGLPVSISVVVSLLIALTIIPLAMAHMPMGDLHFDQGRISRFRERYGRFLAATLRHRTHTLLGILVVVALTSMLGSKGLIFTDSPGSDDRRVFMHLHHENAKTLEGSKQVFFRVEKLLNQHREELEVQSVYLSFDRIHGDIELFLTPKRNLLGTEEVAQRVREILPKLPGTIVRVNQSQQGSAESISILLQGEDSQLLETFAEEAVRRLGRVEGVLDLNTGLDERRDEIDVYIDRQRSWRQGLSPQAIAGALALGVRGRKVGMFRAADRDLDIVLQLGDENRQSLETLKNLPLPARPPAGGAGGGLASEQAEPRQPQQAVDSVPLSNLASFRFTRALGEIQRQQSLASLEIKVTTNEKDIEALRQRIMTALDGFTLPRGYLWTFGSRFQRRDDDQSQSSLSAVLAAVLVFLIMGVLFESFLHPITVMLTLPFAWLGFVWMMAATRTPVDILGSVGLIVLIGVVVNNSIVVVDRVNQLRAAGWDRDAALVQAGKDRMRPVLMTALTTILGLVPMALDATLFQYKFNEFLQAIGLGFMQLGSGNTSAILYSSLGRSIMGGLIAGTLSTLILTPYFYLMFDELKLYLQRLLGTLWPGRRGRA